MTTIVYHQNRLYADTMASVSKNYPDGDSRNPKCTSCGHEHEYLTHKYVEKIKLLAPKTKCFFRGEQILTVAGSGIDRIINNWISTMSGAEDWEAFVKNALKLYHPDNRPSCTLLLVTANNVHVIYMGKSSPDGLHVVTDTRQGTVAIGNGRDAAYTAIKIYDESPDYAIAVAGKITKGTGGEIDVVDFTVEPHAVKRIPIPALRVNEPTPVVGRRKKVKGAGSDSKKQDATKA